VFARDLRVGLSYLKIGVAFTSTKLDISLFLFLHPYMRGSIWSIEEKKKKRQKKTKRSYIKLATEQYSPFIKIL
jgi:hypothetical protein